VAVYEEGVEFPRSFDINDIPLNSNFTIRAWVQLPQDQTSNGTVYVNTTIRSRLSPEVPFVHTSTGNYLGVAWQPQSDEGGGVGWSAVADTAVLYIKAWWGVAASIIAASAILYKAVVDRERRVKQQGTLPYQEADTSADAWMEQYQQKEPPLTPSTPHQKGGEVPKATYEAMFRHQHGSPEPSQTPVDSRLVSAATVVLDAGTKEAEKRITSTQPAPVQTGDVTPSLAESASGSTEHHEQVSLPSSDNVGKVPVDDLEF